MNFWIFQCKKDRYDISDPAVLFDGMTGYWTANQYRSEMQPGDLVFFWLAGDADYRGIYGVGELTSMAYQWEEGDRKGFSVDIKCNNRLEPYLSVQDVKENHSLENIQILNMPMGSNFLLNEKEGHALMDMAQDRIGGAHHA